MTVHILQETTVWKHPTTPNHIYLVEDYDKLVGYIPQGTKKVIPLVPPMQFNRAGREFKYLKNTGITPANTRLVKSSKGDQIYEVNDTERTCTCPGFQFRGKCKHLNKE